MKCDHYTATLADEDGAEVLAWVCEAVPEPLERQTVGADGSVPRQCYDHAVPVLDGKTVVAVVRWGGNGDGVTVDLKGSIAHQTFGLLRARWPQHSMTRVDVAVDGTASGLFDRAFEIGRAHV